ncbi:Replication factor-A protein [Taphrina deformans PYCC 5710]|uniref:Replication factor-A protein n=1 Tax=Taphrina deformans (strain PYCC 5710 / ATCC 11124 / CBS 356.35 / IMI 108563 / JCM 9778 / NBRC 8474) TaxID=1097556 RepID=R4XA44_TAPDE|nr:Replication factor-A protein [Taphrina deformans PYCC 5710]|eukprot:CCG82663.1 Replication factor-A protein [Taphrina deformans PYCC 5710]
MSNYQSYNDGGYQQTNYNAGGGYNSGGFVASQTTPGGEKRGGNNALRPVQIKQILEASQSHPDADFKIDDSEISALTFCGRVMNVSAAATNTTYKIDDGTGSIEVKQWVDSERATESEIRNDSHVRIHGTLKSFNQKRHVGVTSIKLITDDRELKYHELECRYVSLYFTRGPIGQSNDAGNAGGAGSYGDSHGGGGNDSSELAGKLAQLDPFSRRVMEVIHASPDSNEGINVRTLQGMIGGGGNLLATIESLKEDGHLYTTIDEDHVKSTML